MAGYARALVVVDTAFRLTQASRRNETGRLGLPCFSRRVSVRVYCVSGLAVLMALTRHRRKGKDRRVIGRFGQSLEGRRTNCWGKEQNKTKEATCESLARPTRGQNGDATFLSCMHDRLGSIKGGPFDGLMAHPTNPKDELPSHIARHRILRAIIRRLLLSSFPFLPLCVPFAPAHENGKSRPTDAQQSTGARFMRRRAVTRRRFDAAHNGQRTRQKQRKTTTTTIER